MQQQTDEETLAWRASRNGDPNERRRAFEQLVYQTARLLFARLYLDTGDAHRAEDLVQETFLIAWKRVRSLSEPSKFRAWLLQIAQSVLIDSARRDARKKRSAPLAPASAIEQSESTSSSPIDSASQSEQRERVLKTLRELPEEYRLPLMLRYLQDADYETISRELALTNGSLRGLLSRGMKMLREKMAATRPL